MYYFINIFALTLCVNCCYVLAYGFCYIANVRQLSGWSREDNSLLWSSLLTLDWRTASIGLDDTINSRLPNFVRTLHHLHIKKRSLCLPLWTINLFLYTLSDREPVIKLMRQTKQAAYVSVVQSSLRNKGMPRNYAIGNLNAFRTPPLDGGRLHRHVHTQGSWFVATSVFYVRLEFCESYEVAVCVGVAYKSVLSIT